MTELKMTSISDDITLKLTSSSDGITLKNDTPLGSDVITLRADFFKCGCSPHKKVGNPKKLRSSVYINSGYKFRLAILIVNFSLETVEDSGWLHDFAFLTNCVQ